MLPDAQRRFALALGFVCLVSAVAPRAILSAGEMQDRAAPEATEGTERMERLERRTLVMGTLLHLVVEAATRPEALAASEAAIDALETAEARLSTWTDAGELSRFLATPAGESVPVGPLLHRDLAAALHCHDLTGGAFDPTVGPLVAAWDLRGEGRVPAEDELREALASVGTGGLQLSPAGDGAPLAVRRRAGLSIEEGGFGKGAGLGDALRALDSFPGVRARLDLGGQLAFRAPANDERPWTVEVAHPDARRRTITTFAVLAGSVSTTGNGERGLVVGGRHVGHVLDPRTGRPAADFGSLTVWADDPLLADCLSTGLYVLGPDAALERAESLPGVEALVARHGGGIRATSGLRASVRGTHPSSRQNLRSTTRWSSHDTRYTKGDRPSRSRSGPPPF